MAASRFIFTGELSLGAMDSKYPFLREGKTKDGIPYQTISMSVIQAKNNRAFVERYGQKDNVIKTIDTDNKPIEVNFDDATDPAVIATVNPLRKHIIELGEDKRYEFIDDYSFVHYIATHYDEFNGKRFTVTGQVKKNIYKGEISDRFQIQNLYAVDEDVKSKLQVTFTEFWTIDDYDFSDWASEKRVYLNGRTFDYIDKKTKSKYVEQTLVFDASKINYDDPKHVALKDFKLKQIGLEEVDGKLKTTFKKNKVYTLTIICAYVNGQKEVEFDESTLTANQKMAIELGINKLSDFAPKGQIYGESVIEYKIQNFKLLEQAENGAYDSEMSVKEYEDEFFSIAPVESLSEALGESAVKVNEPSDDMLEDLFG